MINQSCTIQGKYIKLIVYHKLASKVWKIKLTLKFAIPSKKIKYFVNLKRKIYLIAENNKVLLKKLKKQINKKVYHIH